MISVVILTINEEQNIMGCMKTLGFADEIIVIDDNSEDRTTEIASNLGAKVFVHTLDGDFSKQRNYALEKAKNDWVLFVDADERVSLFLADEITRLINNPSNTCDGFYIKRMDTMWGKKLKYGETSIKLLRLGKKGAGLWWGKVHEQWEIKGKVGQLQNSLTHYPHQNLTDFLEEINFYTDIRSKELYSKIVKAGWFSIVLYPLSKFLVNYIFKRGFMDGIEGLIFAITMSLHSFLVRGKLWILWQKK